MARTPIPLVFPTWRDLWQSIDGVNGLLDAADAMLERRMTGNQRIPLWTMSPEQEEQLATAAYLAQRWSEGPSPHDPKKRSEIIRYIHEKVSPSLRSAAWPRWLLLERAFLDASATGDLLFAALVLRTLGEEVIRLHALDVDADRLAALAESTAAADRARLNEFLFVAWASILTLPSNTRLEGLAWQSAKKTAAAMPRLEGARVALNSYVHPNYGSHIAALFPEGAAAARTLLDAVVAIFEAFFALSWSETPISSPTRSTGVGPRESWKRTTRRLLSRTLPEARRTAENKTPAAFMAAPNLTEWVMTDRDDLSALLRDPSAAPLFEGLPQCPSSLPDDPGVNIRIWEGARSIDVLGFSAARRVERQVVSEFPSGAPDMGDQARWLHFNALSLQLAHLLDQAKVAALKVQLVRQVVQGNGLAALICARSLIEHRAFAVWLTNQVGLSLDELATQVQSAAPLPAPAGDVETALAKFLVGQSKETEEERRAWVVTEDGIRRSARLKLRRIIDDAFSNEDGFRKLYALSSAAMHGRACRGIDLLRHAGGETTRARRVGLLVLERIADRGEEMDQFAAVAKASTRMEHAALLGGAPAAETDEIARQMFGNYGEAFVAGVDYSGDGTNEKPFVIMPHLQYNHASCALLAQLGIDVSESKCAVDNDLSGALCDRWLTPDREYWFKIPTPNTRGLASAE